MVRTSRFCLGGGTACRKWSNRSYGIWKSDKRATQLNDDSLWPKDLDWDHPEGTPEDLKEIRRLLFLGEIKK